MTVDCQVLCDVFYQMVFHFLDGHKLSLALLLKVVVLFVELLVWADLSHSALAVTVTVAAITGHPAASDSYGRCTAATEHSVLGANELPVRTVGALTK